ncbi:MAG TPA: hypothetical protein VFU31_10075 [Candidatus Binatia bacterium]|nr:hypothetical protein [Candidatus Binatia bacterium]
MTHTFLRGQQRLQATIRFVRRRQFQRWVSSLVVLTGCATTGPRATGLPDSVKADLNTIAVTAILTPDEVTVWRPSAKDAAREGAKTAMEVATALTFGLWPIAYYFAGAVAVPTVGAGIGVIVGAIKAPPQKEIEQIEVALRGVVEEARISRAIRDTIIAELRETTPKIRALAMDFAEGDFSLYESLAKQGIRTVLKLKITKLEVGGPWGSDHRGNILMTVAAQVVRATDGVAVYSHDFEFAGDHGAGDWFQALNDDSNDTRLLQEGLTQAAQTLARDIARALLTPNEMPSDISDNAPSSPRAEKEEDTSALLEPDELLWRAPSCRQRAGLRFEEGGPKNV